MTKIFETPLYSYYRNADQDAEDRVRHRVVVVGAGPVGLITAIDLAQQGVPVVVVDDNDKVSFGSRAICFSKRSLEIAHRLGCGQPMVDHGVPWDVGKVFFDEREVYGFELLPEPGYRQPAFINLQQYHLEDILIKRLRALEADGAPIELRGRNAVSAIGTHDDHVTLEIDTPEGSYNIETDWLIACDGANSMVRRMLGKTFHGRMFEDNFLIADVVMKADFPSERWFWFDPPFNPGQSALLHKQPDGVWRIDLQLGQGIDKEHEAKAENVIPRIKAMLGDDVDFELEWNSIYTFHCRRMDSFRDGRVIFAGDAAHQVSPFGARGANSGFQDAENLAWKLKLVLQGKSPEALLDSYDFERCQAADENIANSTRSTEFITPKSRASRRMRDAVLDLSARYPFAQTLVNSGRLSVPCIHDGSPLNSADAMLGPDTTRPGAPCPDAPLGDGFLLDHLGNEFVLLAIDTDAPEMLEQDGITARRVQMSARDGASGLIANRFLGDVKSGVFLVRPDQHIAARRPVYDDSLFRAALRRATAKE